MGIRETVTRRLQSWVVSQDSAHRWMWLQAIPERLFHDPAKATTFRTLAAWRDKNYVNEWDQVRLVYFMRLLEIAAGLPDGDYIEMGTQYGGTAKYIFDLMPKDRALYCFDTFAGFPQADLDEESKIRIHHFTTASIVPLAPEIVRQNITDGAEAKNLFLVPGRVPESLAPYSGMRWRFAHLDMDLYEPTRAGLIWLWPRMVPGGVLFFHDYDGLLGVKKAVDEVLHPFGITATPLADRWGSAAAFKPLVTG